MPKSTNLFKLLVFYILGKPIKLDVFDRVSTYVVAEVSVEVQYQNQWNARDVIIVRLIPHSGVKLKRK
jgi:hypothetical protein